MAKGEAFGDARRYQELCRDLIRLRAADGLVPYTDDGIDASIRLGATVVTFDVALRDATCGLVLAECKRWRPASPIKQDAVYAFWAKVEHVREALGVPVAALFMASSPFQTGAVTVAEAGDITAIRCAPDQALPDFAIAYQHYAPERAKKVQRAVAQFRDELRPTGSLRLRVIRGDGRVEEYGEV